MRRNSFFVRLLAGNLILVLVTIMLGGYISHRLLENQYQRRQQLNQQRITSLLQMYFQRQWGQYVTRGPESLDRFFKLSLGPRMGDLRISLIAPDGTVLADSSDVPAGRMENHATPDRPEVLNALDGKDSWDQRSSETLQQDFNYFAVPIRENNRVVAALRVAMPIRALSESKSFIQRSLLIGAVAALVVTVVLGVWLSWMWYSPLRQLTRAADQIAQGRLDRKVYVSGAAELRQLADALNEMRESLARQMETIAGQRANLQTVMRNLDDGIIATDLQDKVVLANEGAEYLFKASESPVGQNLQQVVRVARLVDTYRTVQQSGQADACQFTLERNGQRLTFAARVSPVEGQDVRIGFVLVVRDITELVRTMEMKNQFVVNASHELRTPLASIRAAVDSLNEAEDAEEARHFTTILNRQVTRLEELTRDLLAFSTVEDTHRELHPETFTFQQLGDWLEEEYTSRADHKDQAFGVEVDQPDTVLYCDRRLLEMVLQNLVDNAMKYTPAEGTVAVRLWQEGDSAMMCVSDNGVGISQEDQPRVFERFYQAEPSRSGDIAQRGTGLGLAIVKHAADRLNASVCLESALGQGTSVTVQLPIRTPPERPA